MQAVGEFLRGKTTMASHKQFACKLTLAATLVAAAVAGDNASATTQGPTTPLEPNRFAIVTGVQIYTNGLSINPTGCNDAKVIYQALLKRHWKASQIFYQCPIATDQLRGQLLDFLNKVNNTDRALLFVYFSGHGAEIDGKNYLFGADSAVDLRSEANAYLHAIKVHESPSLFGRQAVNLDDTLNTLHSNMYGKAVILVLDACRTNEIREQLAKLHGAQVFGPARTGSRNGVYFAFASKSGEVAPAGVLGEKEDGISQYAAALSKAIEQSPSGQKFADLFAGIVNPIALSTHGDQTPDSDDLNIPFPPSFCIEGCKSTAAQWQIGNSISNYAVDHAVLIDDQKSPVTWLTALQTTVDSQSAYEYLKPASAHGPDRDDGILVRAAYTLPTQESPPVGDTAVTAPATTPPATPMTVELEWCSGDSKQAERYTAASSLYKQLKQFQNSNQIIDNVPLDVKEPFEITPLLFKSTQTVQPPSNSVTGTKSGNNIYISARFNSSNDWAAKIAEVSPNIPFANKEFAQLSPNFIRISLCASYNPDENPAVIVTQIVEKEQKLGATQLNDDIKHNFSSDQIWPSVGLVPITVKQTNVRYFYQAQKEKAYAIASFLSDKLGHNVKVIQIGGTKYFDKLQGTPIVEIWYANSDHLALMNAN